MKLGGENIIEHDNPSIKDNEGLFRSHRIFLFLGLILLGSIILSGAVSSTDVSISHQNKLNHENISNLQSQSNPSQNNNKINFQSNTIKSTENGNFIIGKLIIPRLGVDCSIRSDTVNAYNAAYHYPQSASFGQHGECGIMSHRTTYSALFRHLDALRIGDKVIIINLKKTKYTYSVTSNGKDIRWDYKTNPITFTQSGQAKLLLVTCYPLGYEKAAFITHCKLISADYIPRVLSTTPNNLKINMSRTSTIAIKLSEYLKTSTYYNHITLKNLNTGKYVTITKSISRNTLYLKMPLTRLAYNWYQVTIPKFALKDYADNNLAANYTFKFKTGA